MAKRNKEKEREKRNNCPFIGNRNRVKKFIDYFIWVMNRKGSMYIEKIVDVNVGKLKG